MATQHTPGPWEMHYDHDGYTVNKETHEYDGLSAYIARVFDDVGDPGEEEGEANARLIAAAPDMLAALVRLEKATTMDEVRDILAKARERLDAIK